MFAQKPSDISPNRFHALFPARPDVVQYAFHEASCEVVLNRKLYQHRSFWAFFGDAPTCPQLVESLQALALTGLNRADWLPSKYHSAECHLHLSEHDVYSQVFQDLLGLGLFLNHLPQPLLKHCQPWPGTNQSNPLFEAD